MQKVITPTIYTNPNGIPNTNLMLIQYRSVYDSCLTAMTTNLFIWYAGEILIYLFAKRMNIAWVHWIRSYNAYIIVMFFIYYYYGLYFSIQKMIYPNDNYEATNVKQWRDPLHTVMWRSTITQVDATTRIVSKNLPAISTYDVIVYSLPEEYTYSLFMFLLPIYISPYTRHWTINLFSTLLILGFTQVCIPEAQSRKITPQKYSDRSTVTHYDYTNQTIN